MIKFTKDEENFLQSIEEARIATSHVDIPHVKPVSFVYHDNAIFIATDYHTRTFKNLKINPRVSVTIDIYEIGKHKAVCVQGIVEILENGEKFLDMYKNLKENLHGLETTHGKKMKPPFSKLFLQVRQVGE